MLHSEKLLKLYIPLLILPVNFLKPHLNILKAILSQKTTSVNIVANMGSPELIATAFTN